MSKIHNASTLVASFNKRFTQPGVVDLAASGETSLPSFPDTLPSVQAAGVHSFSAPGKMVFVKALEHFLVLGDTIQAGEYVELPETDAKYLVRIERAEFATDAEVAAAQKGGK